MYYMYIHARLYIVYVRPHDMYTFNTQQASYQFWRGHCDACAADHVINSSRPSASFFPPPHLIITRNAHGAERGYHKPQATPWYNCLVQCNRAQGLIWARIVHVAIRLRRGATPNRKNRSNPAYALKRRGRFNSAGEDALTVAVASYSAWSLLPVLKPSRMLSSSLIKLSYHPGCC